jgi:tetratricopeptide (TPR) repeat protein
MSRTYSWDQPKDPSEPPRGSDDLYRGLARVTNVVAQELVDLRRRADRAHAADLLRDELSILFSVANLSELIGAFRDAVDAAQQAAALARQLGDHAAELDALNTVAAVWGRCGNLADAEELQQDIRDRRRESVASRGAAAGLINTAVLEAARANHAEALDRLDDAFRLARGADDPFSSGQVLNNAGVLFLRQGGLDEAERLLQRSSLLRQRSGDRRGQGHTLNNLGLAHFKRGDLVGAIPFLEMAAVLLADVGDLPSLVVSLSNNVVVFEHHYLDTARVLRDSFARAVEALSTQLPTPVPDANLVRLKTSVAAGDMLDVSSAGPSEWGLLPDGGALLSTQLLELQP